MRQRNQVRVYTRLDVAAKMPPLRHSTGEVFDMDKSEVMNWLLAQPGVKQLLFDKISQPGIIIFNKTTGTWQGRDFKEYQF